MLTSLAYWRELRSCAKKTLSIASFKKKNGESKKLFNKNKIKRE